MGPHFALNRNLRKGKGRYLYLFAEVYAKLLQHLGSRSQISKLRKLKNDSTLFENHAKESHFTTFQMPLHTVQLNIFA